MRDPTTLLAPTVSNGPSAEFPDWISAVKPGVSVVTTIRSGAPVGLDDQPDARLEGAQLRAVRLRAPERRSIAVRRQARLIVVLAVAAVGIVGADAAQRDRLPRRGCGIAAGITVEEEKGAGDRSEQKQPQQ